jgi:hypothetical protein
MQRSRVNNLHELVDAQRNLIQERSVDGLSDHRRTGRPQEEVSPFNWNLGAGFKNARGEICIDRNLKGLAKLSV